MKSELFKEVPKSCNDAEVGQKIALSTPEIVHEELLESREHVEYVQSIVTGSRVEGIPN